MWTHFYDMHSGGDCKEPPYGHIFIEAKEDEAVTIFYNRFGHNPLRVTCTCCGEDYSISEEKTLLQVSGYMRGCTHEEGKGYIDKPSQHSYSNRYLTRQEFLKRPDVLVIRKKDILPEERIGNVPEQGYVWQG